MRRPYAHSLPTFPITRASDGWPDLQDDEHERNSWYCTCDEMNLMFGGGDGRMVEKGAMCEGYHSEGPGIEFTSSCSSSSSPPPAPLMEAPLCFDPHESKLCHVYLPDGSLNRNKGGISRHVIASSLLSHFAACVKPRTPDR
jgi:hypothetical protein